MRSWLLEMGDIELLEHLLNEICSDPTRPARALLDAVCSLNTPVEILMATKSTAKRLAADAPGPAHKAATKTLYHLSVASALGRHGRNISSKNQAEYRALYESLAAKLSDEELAGVFKKAVIRLSSTTSI